MDEERGQRHRLIDLVAQMDVAIARAEAADGNHAMTEHLAVLVVDAEAQMRQIRQNHLLEDEKVFAPHGVDAIPRDRGSFVSGVGRGEIWEVFRTERRVCVLTYKQIRPQVKRDISSN